MSIDSANDYIKKMEVLTSMLDAIAENNNSVKNNTARNITNFRKDMVLVTNSAGRISASKVKKEKLLFLNNLTSPIQYQIEEIADKLTDDLDSAYISAYNDKKTKIYNLSLNISAIAANVSFDNIQDGVRNKFIVNDELNSDLTITGNLTVTNDIRVSNAYTNVDTTIYETNSMRLTQENLASPPVDPMLHVTQKGVLNIIDMYYISNNLLIKPDERNFYRLSITNDGSMGVGTNKPLEKLDIRGNLGVSGKINDVTAAELNNLRGLENNIKYMLDKMAEDSSVTAQQWNTDCTSYQPKLTEEINGILTTVTNATEEMQTEVELFMINAADSKQDTLVYGDGIDYDPSTNSVYTTRTSQWAVSQDGEQITFGNIKIAQDTLCVDDGVNVVNFVSQSQFDLKQNKASVTGAVTTIVTDNLQPSKVLISNSNHKIGISSNVSVEKLQFLNGTRSPIQDQIDTLNQRTSNTITEIDPIASNFIAESSNVITTKLQEKNDMLATKQDAITFGQGLEYISNTRTLQISGAVPQSYTGPTIEPQKEFWKGRYFFNNTDNLMLWYTFDNNNFLLNNGYLGKDYNLINNGATSNSNAAVGDGSVNINSGYLQISKDIDLTGLKECTVAFWLKKDATLNTGGNDVIMSDQNVNNADPEINFRISRNGTGNDWKIQCFGATFLTTSTLADWGDGDTNWNHYCIAIHKTDVSNAVSIEIFKNGVSEFTGSSSTWKTGISKSLRIGYDGDVNRQLKGHLDDVRIYDKKLSEDEITKLYTKNTTVEYLAYGENDYDRRIFYNELTDLPIWYKFDSSDDLTVNSGNTGIANDLVNDNVVVNTTDYIAGSACATFNGSTSTMTIGDFDFNTSTEYSICFWMRKNVNSASDNDVIVTDATSVFKISKTNASWTVQAFGSTFTNTWVADTAWHHYCFKFIKTSPTSGVLLQIYKDGKIVNTLIKQTSPWTSVVAQLKLGKFAGDLDDFRIYNRAITTGEINVLYFTGGFTNMYEYVNDTTDMIAWYKFEGDFKDSSGNGYDLENTGCIIDTDTPVVGSGSVKFNGSSYLTYNTSSTAFSQDVMTICFWAYITDANASQIISTQSDTAGWMFQVDSSNNFKYFISNTEDTIFTFGTEGNPVYNSWFHVVAILSKNTNNQYIYINGNLKSIIANTTYTSGVSSTLRIGAQVGTPNFYMSDGSKVDDVRIYNRVLSSNEVSYIYDYTNANLDIYNNRGLLTTSSSVVHVYDNGIALQPVKIVQQTATIIHNGVTVQPTPITVNETDYVYAAFTSTTGTNSITFDQETVCDLLVVAGGGGGGGGGGAGGAGGLIYIENITLNGTYAITVGDGGNGGGWPNAGALGQDSAFGTIIAKGGGGGVHSGIGLNGGSGGGSGYNPGDNVATGISGQGNNGGTTYARAGVGYSDGRLPGGGGGGAGGVGGDGVLIDGVAYGGNGGAGRDISITGVSVGYAGGGAGGVRPAWGDHQRSPGTATHGGGNGGVGHGTAGTPNTGGGGGAAGGNAGVVGGKGGSGIVIVRWKSFAPKFVATADDVTNKQNALTFGRGLEYDPTTKTLIAGGWKETGYLSKGDVKVYGNKISLLTTIQDVAAPIRKYPPVPMSSASETLTASYGSGVYTASISTSNVLSITNCLAWYKFEDNYLDSSGNNRHLTYNGTLNANISLSKVGNKDALKFASANPANFLTTPYINKNVPLSVSFWFYLYDTTHYTVMAYSADSTVNLQIDVADYRIYFNTRLDTDSGWTIQPYASIPSLNTWHFVAYTLSTPTKGPSNNQIEALVYLNGEINMYTINEGSKTSVLATKTNFRTTTNTNFTIGKARDATRGFKGALDDVRIHDRILTAEEVKILYLESSAYACFDGVTNGGGGGFAIGEFNKSIVSDYTGEWIKLVMPVRIYLSYINMYSVSTNPEKAPSNYRLYGSNDGTNWVQLLDVISAQYKNNKHTSPNIYDKPMYRQYAICVQQTVANGTALEIAEIELYGRETTPTISAEEFYNDTGDMIAWYKFAGNFKDSSGNGYDATAYGSPTFVSPNIVSFQDSGNHSQYVSIPINTIKSNGVTKHEFTFSFWINKTQSYTSYGQFFSIDSEPSNTGSLGDTIFFGQTPSSPNKIHLRYGSEFVEITTIYDIRATNVWNHYVFFIKKVGNTANIKFYVNGTEYTTFASARSWIELGSYIKINRWLQNQYQQNFGKQVKDFRIYNRALTAQEINVLYNIDSIRETLRPTSGNGSVATDITTVQNIKPLYSSDTINMGNHIEICNGKNQTGLTGATAMSVTGDAAATTTNYCMRSKRDIWVDGADVIFTSDERIKKDIKDIDDDSALEKLLAIEPKTYKYIDYKTRGTERVYGFISQQVRSVLPEATTQTQRFIPNIYRYCYFQDNIIYLPTDFDTSKLVTTYNGSVTCNKLRLIDHNQTSHDVSFSVVFESDLPRLRIKGGMPTIRNSNQIFVYGTLIDDLVTIDKSYIFTLNVCATQSLSRKIETVGSDISAFNNRAASIEERLAALETKMTS